MTYAASLFHPYAMAFNELITCLEIIMYQQWWWWWLWRWWWWWWWLWWWSGNAQVYFHSLKCHFTSWAYAFFTSDYFLFSKNVAPTIQHTFNYNGSVRMRERLHIVCECAYINRIWNNIKTKQKKKVSLSFRCKIPHKSN